MKKKKKKKKKTFFRLKGMYRKVKRNVTLVPQSNVAPNLCHQQKRIKTEMNARRINKRTYAQNAYRTAPSSPTKVITIPNKTAKAIIIIKVIIIKSIFSDDNILSTGSYLTYGPLLHSAIKHMYIAYTFYIGKQLVLRSRNKVYKIIKVW